MLGVIGAGSAFFPAWMPKLAFASAEKAPGDALVCVFLRGGMDSLSAVAPYAEGARYYDARPTLAVPEPGKSPQAALDLDGRFGLHPTLAPLQEIYQQGDLAIVHAVGSPDPSRSHFDSMRYMEYGVPGDKSISTGWLGRHLQSAAWQNGSPFRAVGMGAMPPDSLRGPVAPLALESIADFHFKGREGELRQLRQSLNQLYAVNAPTGALDAQAKLVFETIDVLDKLNANTYQPAAGANYPDDEFGLGLRQIAQLIKAGLGLEVACVDLGGWDTHENQGVFDGGYNALLESLGRGLSAFYADLGDKMQRVTLVTMSEFGRRVAENGSQGTDHGHGSVMFVMGGGANGGQVFTRWPSLAPAALDNGDLAITTDYRDVLAEIISRRLLNPSLDKVFPGHQPAPVGVVKEQ